VLSGLRGAAGFSPGRGMLTPLARKHLTSCVNAARRCACATGGVALELLPTPVGGRWLGRTVDPDGDGTRFAPRTPVLDVTTDGLAVLAAEEDELCPSPHAATNRAETSMLKSARGQRRAECLGVARNANACAVPGG
jgi:hypothetical protein